MDIQKEREAFEAWLFREYPNAKDFMIVYMPDENIYEHRPTQVRWEAWQAAKASAVPDGYVVVPKEPTYAMVEAGSDAGYRNGGHIESIYEAMIEAAQEQNQ